MGTAKLGVVLVMMVVGASPDAAGTEHKDPKNLHHPFRQPRVGQNGVMLLIVINDEQAQDQQTGENAANKFAGEVEVPKSSGDGSRQEQRS